jgi:hypothetical protein
LGLLVGYIKRQITPVQLLQIMRRTVAITAFRKFLQHCAWMGFSVAQLTWWYVFVFFLMTIGAGKIMVFGLVRLQLRQGFPVTSPTVM